MGPRRSTIWRRITLALGVASLLLGVCIAVMCIVTVRWPIYVERDLGYYRGPAEQVWQGVDDLHWVGMSISVDIRRIAWPHYGPEALAAFQADHPPQPAWHVGRTRGSGVFWYHNFAFTRYQVQMYPLEYRTFIAFPGWAIFGPLLLFGGIVLHRLWWRPRRRLRVGRCPVCGYDLRATPDRCPECGKVVLRSAADSVAVPLPTSRGIMRRE